MRDVIGELREAHLDQVRLIEIAFNWREGIDTREELHKWLRDFAIKSGQRLIVDLVAGWIGCDIAFRSCREEAVRCETSSES